MVLIYKEETMGNREELLSAYQTISAITGIKVVEIAGLISEAMDKREE